jgi:chemotaxis response regulator CheB
MAKRKNAPVQRPDYTTPRTQTAFPVSGIGAPAGCVAAPQTLLRQIPADTGAAFAAIVHLEPAHSSELAEILARKASMPVRQVNANVRLEPDNIHVIPPNRGLFREPPATGGFGTWLIGNGLPDAPAGLSFPEDGVLCTAILPEEALRHE